MRRGARLAPALALALLACAGGRAGRQVRAIDLTGWREVRSPRFVVVGNVEPESLRRLADDLAFFDALVRKATNARLDADTAAVRLYVFREAAQARVFTGAGFAGVLIPTLEGYFAFLEDEGNASITRHVLFHEYAHYVLESNRRVVYPRWYNEGQSEFLGSARRRDGAIVLGAAPPGRLETLARRGALPLESLFAGGDIAGRNVGRFYATSWALVHYLNMSREGRARLGAYVARLAQGEPWRDAYAASFDESLPQLEAALAAHVQQLEHGARIDYVLPDDWVQVSLESSEAAVAPAEIAYELGRSASIRLQCCKLRWEDDAESRALARALFEQALERNPGHARARAELAWSEALDGHWAQADAFMARARSEAPDDPWVLIDAARVQALRAGVGLGGAAGGGAPGTGSGESEAALATLERAVRLAPRLPEAHAELARLYAATGQTRRAVAAYERARDLGAWSPPLDVALAQEYLRAGEPARAEALVRPLAGGPHDSDVAREARRLLSAARGAAAGTPP